MPLAILTILTRLNAQTACLAALIRVWQQIWPCLAVTQFFEEPVTFELRFHLNFKTACNAADTVSSAETPLGRLSVFFISTEEVANRNLQTIHRWWKLIKTDPTTETSVLSKCSTESVASKILEVSFWKGFRKALESGLLWTLSDGSNFNWDFLYWRACFSIRNPFSLKFNGNLHWRTLV